MQPAASPGRLIVISGPSGVGKGSVVAELLRRDPTLALSTSTTTRPRREGESDGVEYQFVDDATFDAMIADEAFLEWADVFGYRYGTPHAQVDARTKAGTDVLLEIDVQGARSIRERVSDAVLIFLEPPTRAELERRLRERGTEDEAAIERRLAQADQEMAEKGRFDHVVRNDELDRACNELTAIIEGYRQASTGG